MTVRNITKTTVSVICLIVGFVFFRLYYLNLLIRFLYKISGNDGYAFVIVKRLFPNQFIGAYYPGLFYFCVIVIIAARLIDAILDHKAGLKLLSSFGSPLFLTLIISIILCIVQINILQLWAVIFLCMIICLHSTLKRLLLHSETVGNYANLKLIKGFFVTIKDAVQKIIKNGIWNFNNPVDEITVLSVSTFVLLLDIMAVISFIVYMASYWRLIFLAQLIGSF